MKQEVSSPPLMSSNEPPPSRDSAREREAEDTATGEGAIYTVLFHSPSEANIMGTFAIL